MVNWKHKCNLKIVRINSATEKAAKVYGVIYPRFTIGATTILRYKKFYVITVPFIRTNRN